MSDTKALLDAEGAASEAGKDAPLRPGTSLTRGHGRTKTLQVRLNDDEYAALSALAETRNVPVSTLVRSLILPVITPGRDTPAARIERLRRELDLLSQQIA
ncbi:hypothetical protein CLV47_11898 [Antricoccus suffuscus]|uniref:Uncharacterized protein n=1 Tax=Antricoccus suffuscus TaxID=1629062 RepID=A0A2T0ZTV7_9ACTN|nr:hypothetical protein [Antricoccus suffuscus]PRZ39734.1 hypothetical protein CLV47_11898 [Antricoccus suffuscus]